MEPLVFADGSYQSLMWIAFGLFVGIALAIDLGMIESIRRRISSKNKNSQDNKCTASKSSRKEQKDLRTCIEMDRNLDFTCRCICRSNFCKYGI